MHPAASMDLMKLFVRIQWENVKHSAQDPAQRITVASFAIVLVQVCQITR